MKKSSLGRVLYFSIPEQKIIYFCMKEYLKIDPDNEDAKTLFEDFERDIWKHGYGDK